MNGKALGLVAPTRPRPFHLGPGGAYTVRMARFLKMHGCGNDFVVFDERAGRLASRRGRRRALADRRTRHRLRPAHR